MRYGELYDPEPRTRIDRGLSSRTATLFVTKAEWPKLRAFCATHQGRVLDSECVSSVIPAFRVVVLCPSSHSALGLSEAWLNHLDGRTRRSGAVSPKPTFTPRSSP